MCGIVGFWAESTGESNREIVCSMMERLDHRGPDDEGFWLDKNTGLAMAHKRLSIIDLSSAGHQPMISPCGRYVLTYNGEIYNHHELRDELDKHNCNIQWRGHSDTETLLAVLQFWGVEKGLKKLNGMFAFALWDNSERILYIARDRLGEKPLYYGRTGSVFLFGSELKALTEHPSWRGRVDRDSLALYMRYNYVPAPWSIFHGIKKLPPAHYAVIQHDGKEISQAFCYWDVKKIAEEGVGYAADINDTEDMANALDDLLQEAVGLRMEADVPLGTFLSGGYDSTMVTAQMQKQSSTPVRTFSIGFEEKGYNEADHALAVANQLKTDHTELYVTPAEAQAVIPKLPAIWDEPFADSSQIPTFLVSQLARRHVTVSLSGDGGDELFGGYTRYFIGGRLGSQLTRVPHLIRSIGASALKRFPAQTLNSLGTLFPGIVNHQALGDKLHKLADVLTVDDGDSFYHGLVSHWKEPERVVLGSKEPETIFHNKEQWPNSLTLVERMMYFDTITYLPDDILTKVDRASMAVSLEARVPLLDHRVVEFAWKLPTSMKMRDGQGKWLFKEVLFRYLPQELMERPKMGFGVPIEYWLRGPLRQWAEELLSEDRLKKQGFFEPKIIRKYWQEHLSGVRRWHYYLWNVLMFQAWLEQYRDKIEL